MAEVGCARCGRQAQALEAPPMGGHYGRLVWEHVCAECWQEWREMSMRLIAHYGLNMGNPLHRQQLRQVMCDFLHLPLAPGED